MGKVARWGGLTVVCGAAAFGCLEAGDWINEQKAETVTSCEQKTVQDECDDNGRKWDNAKDVRNLCLGTFTLLALGAGSVAIGAHREKADLY